MAGGDGFYASGSGAAGDGFAANVLLTADDDEQTALLGSDGKLLVPGGGPRTAAAAANVSQNGIIAATPTFARYRLIGNHDVIIAASWTMTGVGAGGAITPAFTLKFGDNVLITTTVGPIGSFQYWKSSATAQWFYGLVYAASTSLGNLQLVPHGSLLIGGLLGSSPAAFNAAVGDKLDLLLRYEASFGVT